MSFGKYKELKDGQSSGENESSNMLDLIKNQVTSKKNSKTELCLGFGSKIEGKIFLDGVAEIYGEVIGEIVSNGNLVIGESATVKAKITGQEIIVYGKVEGDIDASQKIAFKQPAHIVGNIKTPVLSMEEGVIFKGGCQMDPKTEK